MMVHKKLYKSLAIAKIQHFYNTLSNEHKILGISKRLYILHVKFHHVVDKILNINNNVQQQAF